MADVQMISSCEDFDVDWITILVRSHLNVMNRRSRLRAAGEILNHRSLTAARPFKASHLLPLPIPRRLSVTVKL